MQNLKHARKPISRTTFPFHFSKGNLNFFLVGIILVESIKKSSVSTGFLTPGERVILGEKKKHNHLKMGMWQKWEMNKKLDTI